MVDDEIKNFCEDFKKEIDKSITTCTVCNGSGIAFFFAGCPFPCTKCDGMGYLTVEGLKEWKY